jgi:hypothetical protein
MVHCAAGGSAELSGWSKTMPILGAGRVPDHSSALLTQQRISVTVGSRFDTTHLAGRSGARFATRGATLLVARQTWGPQSPHYSAACKVTSRASSSSVPRSWSLRSVTSTCRGCACRQRLPRAHHDASRCSSRPQATVSRSSWLRGAAAPPLIPPPGSPWMSTTTTPRSSGPTSCMPYAKPIPTASVIASPRSNVRATARRGQW